MVTVDSICIQAYLVFKAVRKKKRRERKNPNFHHMFSKCNLIIRPINKKKKKKERKEKVLNEEECYTLETFSRM